MNPIFRKCPVCGSDAILQDSEIDFSKGFYAKIFRCGKGHRFAERCSLKTDWKEVKVLGAEKNGRKKRR